MIELPITKRWTGDSFGDNEARILNQVKTNGKVAIYKRTVEKNGHTEGFEVFIIKLRFKGQPLPGGMFEKEDRMVYPSANSFGKIAFSMLSLERAEQKYNELIKKADENENEDSESPIEYLYPVGNFSITEFAEKNNIQYPIAFNLIKTAMEEKKIKFVKEERRNTRGKATKLFSTI